MVALPFVQGEHRAPTFMLVVGMGGAAMAMGKRGWIWVGAAVGLVVLLLVVAPMLVDADSYRGRVETALTSAVGRQVTLGHLGLSLWSGSLVADTLAITDDPAFSQDPFLTAKEIRISVEVWPLLRRRELHVSGITIEQPSIALVRAKDGTWNYFSVGGKKTPVPQGEGPGAPGMPPDLRLGKLDIKDGTVTISDGASAEHPRVYDKLNVSVQNVSMDTAIPFQMNGELPGGGALEVNGTVGPVNAKDAEATPLTAQVTLKHADLVAAGLVDPAAGIGGVADLEAKLQSDGRTEQVDGDLHLAELRLAKNGTPSKETVGVAFSVSEDSAAKTGKVTRADVSVGKAVMHVTGTYETWGTVATAALHVGGSGMPIEALAAFLPSLGVELPAGSKLQGGTLMLALDVTGTAAAPVVTGMVKASNVQLEGFDLGSKLAAVEGLIGAKTGSTTTVETLGAVLHYGPEGLRTDALDAVVSGLGSATGSGTISPAGALDYRLAVKLAGGVGAVASKAVGFVAGALGSGAPAKGGGIPVRVGGTTRNPTFAPDLGGVVGGVGKTGKIAASQATTVGKKVGGLAGLFKR